MNLFKTIEGKAFDEVKGFLKTTYQLQVKEDKNYPNLYMIIYPKEETDEFKNLVNDNPFMKECRGVILEKNTNLMVCPGNTDSVNYDHTKSFETYGFKWNKDVNKMSIQEVYEGTLIRLYYYDNDWMTATNRCLNAKNARWETNKTFHEHFLEAMKELSVDYQEFDKKYCYYFLVQNPENYGVFPVLKPTLYYLYSKMVSTSSDENITFSNIKSPVTFMENPESFGEFYEEYILKKKDLQGLQGCAGYILKDETGMVMYMNNPVYMEANELRGNITRNNLYFLYINLKKVGKVKRYLEFFKEDSNIFLEIEKNIDAMTGEIHKQYCAKFVNKTIKMNEVTFEFRPLVYKLNGEYVKNRNNIITKQRIKDYIWGNMVPEQVAFLYNAYTKNSTINAK
jgi:hypothetical protein